MVGSATGQSPVRWLENSDTLLNVRCSQTVEPRTWSWRAGSKIKVGGKKREDSPSPTDQAGASATPIWELTGRPSARE
jgi:hypothetical protein